MVLAEVLDGDHAPAGDVATEKSDAIFCELRQVVVQHEFLETFFEMGFELSESRFFFCEVHLLLLGAIRKGARHPFTFFPVDRCLDVEFLFPLFDAMAQLPACHVAACGTSLIDTANVVAPLTDGPGANDAPPQISAVLAIR